MPFFDGSLARIHYRVWEIDTPTSVVLFLHGGGEHSGQFGRLAARLNASGVEVWAIDHLGHGLSGGDRGLVSGYEPLTDDAVTLAEIIADRRPGLPVVLGGFSLGSSIATRVLIRDQAPFAGVFLVGAALPNASRALSIADDGALDFDLSWLGVDPDNLESLRKDPLVQLSLPVGPAPDGEPDLNELASAAVQLTVPVLFLNGSEDALTPVFGVAQWSDQLPNSRLVTIDGGRHNVLNDVDYVAAITVIREFVNEVTSVGSPV